MTRRSASMTLSFFPASANGKVLVIRRGPSKWWHFLLWDRDNGVVEPGSWFTGMIYPDRCDLSPRGDWMLLIAYRGTGDPIAWTALCRPPSVKAVVFWPQPSARMGGGFFDGRLPVIWLNIMSGQSIQPELREENPFEFGYTEKTTDYFGGVFERLTRDGWKLDKSTTQTPSGPVRWHKTSPTRKHRLYLDFFGSKSEIVEDPTRFSHDRIRYQLSAGSATEPTRELKGIQWANWNRRGELCYASDGELRVADASDVADTTRLIMDMKPLRPKPSMRPASQTNIPITNI